VTVVVVTAVPVGLRGFLTRWLLEVAPGVFVGRPTGRVREHLWSKIEERVGGHGRALMIYSAANDQGLALRTCNHDWEPVDFDGLMLLRRPVR
jgi:CRISPR-associated protein Cas2